MRWYATIVEQKSSAMAARQGVSANDAGTSSTTLSSLGEQPGCLPSSQLGVKRACASYVVSPRTTMHLARRDSSQAFRPLSSVECLTHTSYLDELRRIDQSLQEIHPAFTRRATEDLSPEDAHPRLFML